MVSPHLLRAAGDDAGNVCLQAPVPTDGRAGGPRLKIFFVHRLSFIVKKWLTGKKKFEARWEEQFTGMG
jgi:hypothetical protein